MKLKIVIIIGALVFAYFFYVRDRYLHYPIEVSLSNQEALSVDAQVFWRDDERVQFKKPGDPEYYDYAISDLNYLSRIKLAFLPISQSGPLEAVENDPVDLRSVRTEALRAEIQKLEAQIEVLEKQSKVSVSEIEQNTIKREMENLKLELHRIRQRLNTF